MHMSFLLLFKESGIKKQPNKENVLRYYNQRSFLDQMISWFGNTRVSAVAKIITFLAKKAGHRL